MGWIPAKRNPVERDARIECHGRDLRVELMRGGRLWASRVYGSGEVDRACELAKRWLILGPAVVTLERLDVKFAVGSEWVA